MPDHRYKAFISYAHADEAFAASLHDRLERFVVPAQLRGIDAGRRLGTFFRDREELASGGSLSQRILDAIEDAEYLIVVCSDAAARSTWVNREIEAFLRARSLDRVLLVVADTVPAGDVPTPAALGPGTELLAADARPFADGVARARLKLVAGLLRQPFDALARRERQRARRRWIALGAAASTLAVVAVVGVYLVDRAAREADARRQQAAAFVGVFVDDLEARITRYEAVGTLDRDLAKALDFFATLPPEEIDPTALHQYRTALLGIGTVRIRQGKPRDALDVFERALELSQSMVERDVSNASRWYDLAIHTYYIGEAYWELQDFPRAAERIVESFGYAERAAELAPDNFDYQIEAVYELNNVGAAKTRLNDFTAATTALEQSLARIDALRSRFPARRTDLANQEVEAVSWLAEITQRRSDYNAAFAWHEREIALRRQLIADTGIPHHVSRLSDALGYYAQSLTEVGDTARTVEVLREKGEVSKQAIATDPENAFYRERLLIGEAMLANALFDAGAHDMAIATLDAAERGMREMIARDQQTAVLTRDLMYIASSRAYMALETDPERAAKLTAEAMEGVVRDVDRESVDPALLAYYTRCAAVLAAAERRLARPNSSLVQDALALLLRHGNAESSFDLSMRAVLLRAVARYDDARPLESRLENSGYRPPFYRRLRRMLAPTPTA